MKIKLKPIAAAVALSLATGPVFAVDYFLAAKAYDKLLPDGSTVPMWGYVVDPGATNGGTGTGCFNAATNAARQACIDALPNPTAQGPRLDMPPGDTQLRVYLSNGLPEPTSIIIPGQKLPVGNYNGIAPSAGPTWDDGSTGNRTNASQRVRSYVPEAPANGGKMGYIWNSGNAITPTQIEDNGSMLYHSGTHPQKQVYMGLAGLVTRDAAAGEVYPGVPYSSDVVLFYSDIDPAFNQAVAAGTLATAIDRHPTWFLVNGEPYVPGIGDISAGAAGDNTLLRLASTATNTHVAVLQGMDMTIHGEDGIQYGWEDTAAGTSGTAPRKQYSAMLPPAKTKDAIVVAPASSRYAVYDGEGYMTNPSDPNNEAVGDTVGGMIRFLAFGASSNLLPVASPDSNSAIEGGVDISGNLLGNDTLGEAPTTVTLADQGGTAITLGVAFVTAAGNSLTLNADGSYSYTPTNPAVETFNYTITDGTGDTSSSSLTITVDPLNVAPVADAQAVTTDEDVAAAINLTGSDGNSDPLTYAVATLPANGLLSGTAPALTYTPNANYNGADSFTFVVNDGVQDSAPATVSITVTAVNDAPVADAQLVTTDQGVAVPVNLTGSDVDGDALTYSVVTGPTNGTLNGTAPALSYVPNSGYAGPDSFTFVVNDGTVDSPAATVDITVNSAGTPSATISFSTAGAGAIPGVAGPFDDADVYSVAVYNPETNNVYSKVYDAIADMGLPSNANIDGMSINGTTIYLSFAAASTSVPGLGAVPDEDVVAFDTVAGTWSTYFSGSICGLDASNAGDIDAVSVSGGTLYFSTVGNVAVTGVGGTQFDDADVYTWTSGATSCGRALNAAGQGTDIGLPGNADIDGLTVVGNTYYMSFQRAAGTSVPGGVGVVQDEAVVSYTGNGGPGVWTLVFAGTGQLDGGNAQNVDAINVVPTP